MAPLTAFVFPRNVRPKPGARITLPVKALTSAHSSVSSSAETPGIEELPRKSIWQSSIEAPSVGSVTMIPLIVQEPENVTLLGASMTRTPLITVPLAKLGSVPASTRMLLKVVVPLKSVSALTVVVARAAIGSMSSSGNSGSWVPRQTWSERISSMSSVPPMLTEPFSRT